MHHHTQNDKVKVEYVRTRGQCLLQLASMSLPFFHELVNEKSTFDHTCALRMVLLKSQQVRDDWEAHRQEWQGLTPVCRSLKPRVSRFKDYKGINAPGNLGR